MIIIKLKDQLGNQMFAYAMAKSLCIDRDIELGCYRVPLDRKYINDTNKKYGNDLFTVFKIPENEIITELPFDYKVYDELPISYRNKNSYIHDVKLSIHDNTILNGHFISYEYFENHLNEINEWFQFPSEILLKAKNRLEKISKNGEFMVVSVHFRVGKDYTKLGYKLQKEYWWKAAKYILAKYNNVKFVCLYDRKTRYVEDFINDFGAIDCSQNLIDDMAMISVCDASIVCNSTFSIMSALLGKNKEIVIRPSKYPTQAGYMPENVFPKSWISIGNGKRNIISGICYRLNILLKIIKSFIK